MKHPKFSHSFEVVSELPDPLKPLQKLANNFRWTWHHPTRELFRSMDKELWEAVEHNPIQLLVQLSPDRCQRLIEDPAFLARVQTCGRQLDEYLGAETWFDKTFPGERSKTQIAYFCAEFGISESLPIYSGGLGVLAGDHLKAASDLGLPLVGVGLLYSRGYFRQRLNQEGWQQEVYPQYDFYKMPLKLIRGADGQPVRIEVSMPDRIVSCQVWRCDVGRIALYLLDSNVLENEATDQGITDTLYGGDEEMRLRQEMVLGIGGMQALQAIGIRPTVCHMNEGHAAFLSVERIRQFIAQHNTDFATAQQVVSSGNVFTTHTPVPAGFDLFHPDMLERYLGQSVQQIGLDFHDFLKLGRIDPENEAETFNMAVLAMENANHINGVSKLHAEVSRGMFNPRWPQLPEEEVPIQPITNGVHTTTWVSQRFAQLFDEYLGQGWKQDPGNPENWKGVYGIPDEELWAAMENQRGDLVRFVRKRLQRDLERRKMGRPDYGLVGGVLDPRILTIGFARRFATYKRATLMLSDRDRLKSLLFHPERPIQIVLAGKSHPRDEGGKRLIQELVHFIEHEGARARMVFLEDYDMRVARALTQGVDIWLNNPRRPMEASGTSGMKVIPNGGLNCSILDGWWDEGYNPGVGFAIGDEGEAPDAGQQDWLDSHALYNVLEHEVAPKFYTRVDNGVPAAWVSMVKNSIAELGPQFSTARMVRDYAEKFYMPASMAYQALSANGLDRAKRALDYKTKAKAEWPKVRVVKVSDSAGSTPAIGSEFTVRALVDLAGLSTEEVRVQTLVGKIGPNRDLLDPIAIDMAAKGDEEGLQVFEAEVECDQAGHQGYIVRVLPHQPDVQVPASLSLVTWE